MCQIAGELSCLARTAVAVIFNMDVDGVLEVSAKLFRLLLSKCVPCNNWCDTR